MDKRPIDIHFLLNNGFEICFDDSLRSTLDDYYPPDKLRVFNGNLAFWKYDKSLTESNCPIVTLSSSDSTGAVIANNFMEYLNYLLYGYKHLNEIWHLLESGRFEDVEFYYKEKVNKKLIKLIEKEFNFKLKCFDKKDINIFDRMKSSQKNHPNFSHWLQKTQDDYCTSVQKVSSKIRDVVMKYKEFELW